MGASAGDAGSAEGAGVSAVEGDAPRAANDNFQTGTSASDGAAQRGAANQNFQTGTTASDGAAQRGAANQNFQTGTTAGDGAAQGSAANENFRADIGAADGADMPASNDLTSGVAKDNAAASAVEFPPPNESVTEPASDEVPLPVDADQSEAPDEFQPPVDADQPEAPDEFQPLTDPVQNEAPREFGPTPAGHESIPAQDEPPQPEQDEPLQPEQDEPPQPEQDEPLQPDQDEPPFAVEDQPPPLVGDFPVENEAPVVQDQSPADDDDDGDSETQNDDLPPVDVESLVELEPPATPATADAGGMPPREPPVVPANDTSPKDTFPDAAFLGGLWQQRSDGKYGLDDWRIDTLTEPTMVWGQGDSGFVVFDDTVADAGGDAQTYARLTQQAPGRADGETDPTYRTKLAAYMLPAGTQIARSTTEASKNWGEGGIEQAYVPNFKAVAKPMPQFDVQMGNRDAVQLVVDNDKKSQ